MDRNRVMHKVTKRSRMAAYMNKPAGMSRRSFLLGAAGAGALSLLAACGAARTRNSVPSSPGLGNLFGGGGSRNLGARVDFINQLAIPPLAASHMEAGRRVFELTARAGKREILPGQETTTWGYNGDFLGPTLRARRGEEVVIRFRNELAEMTSLHWHGMHLPAAMDGGPHQPVAPGATWEPQWQIRQPAATLWYHPHPHGETEAHVYRGLAGLFIIDDDESDQLSLPHTYGVDDIPVIVQDKAFGRNGELNWHARTANGLMGDTIVVNGTYAPYVEVRTTKARLRLLNGSTARICNFGFDDDREFHLIATDGGLLAAAHRTRRIQLSPGERAEIVVELEPDSRAVLRSWPPELGRIMRVARGHGEHDTFDVLQLRTAASLQPSPALPPQLATIERLAAEDAVRTREFRLAGRNINGERMDMRRIDAVVTVDTTEIWTVFTLDSQPHNFHIHDVQFQVLDISDSPPPPELAGWKDTIYLMPGLRYRLIMRFKHYTDPVMPYMFHCHLLFHEDQGMMGQFVVVAPGQEDRVKRQLPPKHAHRH